MFQLYSIHQLISDKEIQCDAVQVLFDYMRSVEPPQRSKHIITLFTVRKLKIKPSDQYNHIEVLDTDTGEILEMNCNPLMHQYCIENNIYPSNLIEILKPC